MRIVQFLALVALFSIAYPTILRHAPKLVRFLSMLGRNSLNVFCVGSLLSLAGQIARFVYKGGFVIDTTVVVIGISALALTAWLSEWLERDRARQRQSAPSS
jgi:hypothetical protein